MKGWTTTAVCNKASEGGDLRVGELADIREHDDAGLRQRFGREVAGHDDAREDEVAAAGRGFQRGRECDVEIIGLALERLGAGVAVDEERGELLPNGDDGGEGVVGLERVGVRVDFERVEAGGVEGVREEHLALLTGREGNLLRAALAAVRVEEDAQVGPRALAEVAERGADLERLVDAERELGQVERLDGDVVARLGADGQERDARRDGQALQRL